MVAAANDGGRQDVAVPLDDSMQRSSEVRVVTRHRIRASAAAVMNAGFAQLGVGVEAVPKSSISSRHLLAAEWSANGGRRIGVCSVAGEHARQPSVLGRRVPA